MNEIIEYINELWFSETNEYQDLSYRISDTTLHETIGASHKSKKCKQLDFYVLNREDLKIDRYTFFTGTYKEILEQLKEYGVKK